VAAATAAPATGAIAVGSRSSTSTLDGAAPVPSPWSLTIGSGAGRGQLLGGGEERHRELAGIGAFGRIEPTGALERTAQRSELLGDAQRPLRAADESADGMLARERHRAGDALDEHERQGVQVARRAGGLAARLLGREVARRAERCGRGFGQGGLGQHLGEAEVGDPEAALVPEEEVRGLDVAVDEAGSVGVLESPGGFEADDERLREAQAVAPVEQHAEAAAAQVLGDEEGRPAVLADVVDGEQVRVVEAGGGAGLGGEPAADHRVGGERVVEDLHGHLALELGVLGQEHARRRTHAQQADEPVPAAQHTADLVRGDGGHRHHGA
jgi:hypothetical protein